jgi:hypothetical protein
MSFVLLKGRTEPGRSVEMTQADVMDNGITANHILPVAEDCYDS